MSHPEHAETHHEYKTTAIAATLLLAAFGFVQTMIDPFDAIAWATLLVGLLLCLVVALQGMEDRDVEQERRRAAMHRHPAGKRATLDDVNRWREARHAGPHRGTLPMGEVRGHLQRRGIDQ